MDKRLETLQFEELLAARKKQLSNFRNVPNKLEVLWESENGVVLNNASSTDIESALEAISAVNERVIWITEMDYDTVNFHGILNGILDRLDWIVNVGDHNPMESLGSSATWEDSLEKAVDFAWSKMNGNYIVYAPANAPENSIKERGELFRELIKNKTK